MAESIVTDLLKDALEKLGSVAWKKIIFAKDLKSHIKELEDTKSTIKAALHGVDPFEAGDDIQGNNIKLLRRALDVLDNFLDEQEAKSKQKVLMGGNKFTVGARLFFSPSNQLFSPFRNAESVNAILAELRSIKNAQDWSRAVTSQSSRSTNRGTFSHESGHILDTEVIGRDTDRDRIITRLFHYSNGIESFSAVAIVGVGGIGKTTLAQYVFNDERVKGCFDSQLWVSATPDSGVKDFLAKIIAFVTGEYPVNSEMALLQLQFTRAMQAIVGKKCLLVLDNLWYRDNFRDVWLKLRKLLEVGSLGAVELKVLATARSKSVADIMGITDPYMLRGLAKKDSWLLLRYFAFTRGQEPEPGVEAIGKEIARRCPNNPLVIKAVGCLLAEKHTISDWQAFKDKLASNSAFLMEDDKVMQTLKLSYDELGDNLKRCAAYCSLFPKGKKYKIEQVVRIWMALGFVDEFRDDKSLEDVGKEYVHDLQRLGFFEKPFFGEEDEFEMHDVMHDLMLSIGKSGHQMIDSKTTEIARGVCHVSLSEYAPNWGVLFSEFNGKQLQSILRVSSIKRGLMNVVRLGSGIKNLISRFPNLRVLDLHDQGIEEVPKSISELIHLRYLDLSRNPLCKLPNSITKLVHLQSLKLSYCKFLHNLPRDMSKMVKLRYLLLDDDTITHMPKGIGNLSDLQELNLFVVTGEDSSTSSRSKGNVAADLAELGRLNNIGGELTIHVAGQSKYLVSQAPTAHLEKKAKLTLLKVEFNNSSLEDERFLEGLQPCGNNLRSITISNYGGKKLASWMTDGQLRERFPKLVSIDLFYCKHGGPFQSFLSNRGLYHPIFEEWGPIIRIKVENETSEDEHDHQLKWVPGYLRMKKQLKMGPVELGFTEVRGNGLRELTLRHLYIEGQLASCPPGSGGQQQRDFLVKSCFPNIQILELTSIPELEVIPEEFRDLSSLGQLKISFCRKVKAIPDWIDSLTSLKNILICDCPGLEWLPHQISNLSKLETLDIYACSKTFLEKCRKETGEYWPHIQHIKQIIIITSKGEKYISFYSKNTSTIQNLPAMHPTSNDVASSSFISPFLLGGLCLLLFFACFHVYYVKA